MALDFTAAAVARLAPSPQPAPLPSTLDDARHLRRLDCAGYGRCLDVALARQWEGFTCGGATCYVEQAPEQAARDACGLLMLAAELEGLEL